MKADDAMVPVRDDLIERLREALEAQMEQRDEDENLPSSVARERGLVWLEGWFDLRAADALASDAEGWRPIEEAPKDGTFVLVLGCDEEEWQDAHDEGCEPDRLPWPAYYSATQHIWWIAGGMMRQLEGVTHFRPLPAPPSAMLSAVKAGV